MALPFEFERFEKFEAFHFHHPVELNLPENPLAIAANMATLESGETYIIKLFDDGTFWQTVSIADFAGIKNKFDMLNIAQYHGWPIKVEDMENYNQELVDLVADLEAGVGKTVNGHMFIGFENQGSFGWHKDEGHVMCYMISGTKTMETESGTYTLEDGDWLFMPEGLRHCATNVEDTVMISFGTGSIKPRTKTQMLWGNSPSLIG
ncbi:Cupin domain protein [compost metagenome]